MSAKSGQSVADDVQAKVDWYEAEIERLNELVREQDRRAKTTTALVRAIAIKDGVTVVVTCPSGDERRLMRTMFAGVAALAFSGFSEATKALGLKDFREASRMLFDGEDGEACEADGEGETP